MLTPGAIVTIVLGVGAVAAVVVFGAAHRAIVDAGGHSLAGADREWLVLAALATVAMWFASAVSLFGSMPVRPPIRRVFAVQVVAAFLNHLLPAGSGGVVVNLRFLQRCGLSRGASLGVVGLKSLAAGVTHLILLAGALAIAPSTLDQVRRQQESPSGRASIAGSLLHSRWSAALVTVLVTLIVLMVAVRAPRRWFARHLTRLAEMAQLRTVLRHPGRAAALWLGSLALPLCHAVVLWSILRSLQVPVARREWCW